MPHGKGAQSTRKNPRDETIREDDLEHELEPVSRDVITSPISSASSYSSASDSASSAGTSSSGATLSSVQLEMILAANNRALADSMAANHRTMEASMTSLISSLSPAGPVASTPSAAPSSSVKVPKWTDGEQPFAFFTKLETALTHNGVDKATWGRLLPVYLSGEAEAAFVQVDRSLLGDYEAVKNILLKALGDTPGHADRRWWSLNRLPGETPAQFFLRVKNTGMRRLSAFPTREAVVEYTILSRFLSLLPADSYAAVAAQHPKTGMDAAELLQDFEETKAYSWKRQGWRNSHHSGRREPSRGGSGRSGSPSSSNSGNSSNSGSGVKEVASGDNSSPSPASGAGSSRSKGDRKSKPIICHGCGEPGHIRPQCPKRVRSVRSPDGDSPAKGDEMFVSGWIDGCPIEKLKVDTGADRSLVREDLVPLTAYTGKVVSLVTWKGNDPSKHKLARVPIKVGKVEVFATVAVVEQLDCPALLGADLGHSMTRQLFKAVIANMNDDDDVSDEVPMQVDSVNTEVPMHSDSQEVVAVTRAQAKKAAAVEQAHDLASAQAESQPVSLEDIFSFPDSYFEPEEVYDTSVTSLDEVVEVELPLPELTGDVVKLSEEQKGDETLKAVWKKGEDAEKGYTFEHGVLVHHSPDGFDDSVVRVVVPKSRRLKVLQMGHSSSMAGHFGVKKTHAKISRHFIWPGLWSEVKDYVKTCKGCQLAARQHKSKAPLQPLPCVGEPFQKVAFDLVGPLPRTSSGYKYLLTAMCLYTKFPVAIPLKRVDNHTVLEALMDVFSVYGFPEELLTDQGSVFTSHLTQLVCKTFGIVKLQTSPYHPQSDGALERWHACLKGMIKRSGGKLSEWDRQLKFLLFAYRDTPHCVTGFSPFALLYGREVRGPLQFLKTSWIEEDVDGCSVGDWLVSVKAKLGELSEIVSDRELKAKAIMKHHYDKSASVKKFNVGDMVLMRKPVLGKKMDCAWQGPFEVEKVVSPVTYALKLPGRSCKPKVVHCNLLKVWHTPAEALHRVMVVGDEESACEASPGLKLGRADFVPSVAEQSLLDSVLSKHRDVLSDDPGRTEAALLHIRTGDSLPVRSHPYRVPPKWKDQVKTQLDQLLALGIIEPSSSPWSSSLVIVKKKEGGVRTCVDYRAVNAVTDPDPLPNAPHRGNT